VHAFFEIKISKAEIKMGSPQIMQIYADNSSGMARQ